MTLSGQVYWYQFHQDSTLFPSVTMFQGSIPLFTTRPFKYRDLYPTSFGKLVELEPIEIWNTVVWGSILGESVFLQHVVALVIL